MKDKTEGPIQVWVNPDQRRTIRAAAKAAGMTMSAFLRDAALGLAEARAELAVCRGQVADLNVAVRHLSELLAAAKGSGSRRSG
jgi:uncharacterized protein (DUF1778 family)